jgi:hypothetical protein
VLHRVVQLDLLLRPRLASLLATVHITGMPGLSKYTV